MGYKKRPQSITLGGRTINLVSLLHGGYSVKDWVPNRINDRGERELQIPLANWSGPRTDVLRRTLEHVPPTTEADAKARTHDREFYTIGLKYARGQISKEEAERQIRASDKKLVASIDALPKTKWLVNPVEKLHAVATKSGIIAKMAAEDMGALDKKKFISMDPNAADLPGAGIKKKRKSNKKVDLVKQLRKRLNIKD